jgi:hypothetical protein
MGTLTLDDRWFNAQRARLLTDFATEQVTARRHRAARALAVGAAVARRPDGRLPYTEAVLGHLPRRQETSARGHMQFFRACLDHTMLVPSDALIAAAVQIEWLWYTTPFKKFYRDHLAHVMKVATIALALCEGVELFGAPLIERIAPGLADRSLGSAALRQAARRVGVEESALASSAFWRAAVLEAVRLAGLLHDLAYPSIMAGSYVGPNAAVTSPLPLTTLETSAHDLALAYGDRLIASQYHRGTLPPRAADGPERVVFAEHLRKSHAVQAGVRLLQFASEADRLWRLTPFEAFVVEWAALAAALHDHDKAYEAHRNGASGWLADPANVDGLRPSFTRDPVSYLVALADQLQDFGRLHLAHDARDLDQAHIALRRPVERVTRRGRRRSRAAHLGPGPGPHRSRTGRRSQRQGGRRGPRLRSASVAVARSHRPVLDRRGPRRRAVTTTRAC